eukprot:s2526_g12.t1
MNQTHPNPEACRSRRCSPAAETSPSWHQLLTYLADSPVHFQSHWPFHIQRESHPRKLEIHRTTLHRLKSREIREMGISG